MEKSEMIRRLALVGCLASGSECAHKAQHGGKANPDEVAKPRIYCAHGFSKEGELLEMYRIDPAWNGQPDSRHLWEDRIRGAVDAGAALDPLEAAKAENAKVKADMEAAVKKQARDEEIAKVKADTARLRGEAAPTPSAVSPYGPR